MNESQTFDLINGTWNVIAKNTKGNRRIVVALVIFLFVVTALGLFATIRDFAGHSPYLDIALGNTLVFLWIFLTIFGIAYEMGPPPTQLRLTTEGVELVYLPGRVRYRRRWADKRFRLVLQDFRGRETIAKDDLVLDTGSHGFLGVFLPFLSPPSGYLTPEAFDAILTAARSRGMTVTPKNNQGWRATGGWPWASTQITITQRSP